MVSWPAPRRPARLHRRNSENGPGLRDFKTLQNRGSKEAAIANFMSTHPGTEERLKAQKALVTKTTTPGRRNQARFQQTLARLQKR